VTRLGILGGTFDPVHYGHLDAAVAAQQALGLDEVRLMPSREPPHKTPFDRAAADHRLAMVALAVDGYEALRASDFELRAPGPSYTSVTLRRLADEQGHDPSRLFFVLGSDAFADIGQWHDYPTLLDRGHFVVVSRPDAAGAALKVMMIISDGFPQDCDYGPERGNHEYGLRDTAKALQEAERAGIHTFCITVDRSGHDYLRRMCPEDRYLVIEETAELPEALRKAYRQLTRT